MSPVLGIIASSTQQGRSAVTGSYDALGTVVVPSGGLSSIIFAGIPAGYRDLQIRGISRRSDADNTDGQSFLRFNGDSSAIYSAQTLYGNGGGGANTLAGGSASGIYVYGTPGSSVSSYNGFVIDIFNYASTAQNKTVRWLVGFGVNSTATDVELTSGGYYSLSSINTIQLSPAGTAWSQYSHFALYGVK